MTRNIARRIDDRSNPRHMRYVLADGDHMTVTLPPGVTLEQADAFTVALERGGVLPNYEAAIARIPAATPVGCPPGAVSGGHTMFTNAPPFVAAGPTAQAQLAHELGCTVTVDADLVARYSVDACRVDAATFDRVLAMRRRANPVEREQAPGRQAGGGRTVGAYFMLGAARAVLIGNGSPEDVNLSPHDLERAAATALAITTTGDGRVAEVKVIKGRAAPVEREFVLVSDGAGIRILDDKVGALVRGAAIRVTVKDSVVTGAEVLS